MKATAILFPFNVNHRDSYKTRLNSKFKPFGHHSSSLSANNISKMTPSTINNKISKIFLDCIILYTVHGILQKTRKENLSHASKQPLTHYTHMLKKCQCMNIQDPYPSPVIQKLQLFKMLSET